MREVVITGVGQVPVREHWEFGLRDLAVDAVLAALAGADVRTVEALYIGNMLGGNFSEQSNLGALISACAGLNVRESITLEAACGSGAAAFRQAVLAVASGAVDTAVALGVEKLTEHSDVSPSGGLATAADADYEAAMGLSFVAINALLMKRYMHEFGYNKTDFAPFVINAHQNASHNPNAMFRSPISLAAYEKAKMISDPINLLDSSPVSDGAAAVVVTTRELADRFSEKPVKVHACEVGMDTISLSGRRNPLRLGAVEKSASRALTIAGLKHADIDVYEAHDAFSIMTTLALEASGFAEWGKGPQWADLDKIGIGGSLPMSTFGGLKARGHPVGATGIYQVIEAVSQLRGSAPAAIQVDQPRFAMTQNIGGSASFVVTSILEAPDR